MTNLCSILFLLDISRCVMAFFSSRFLNPLAIENILYEGEEVELCFYYYDKIHDDPSCVDIKNSNVNRHLIERSELLVNGRDLTILVDGFGSKTEEDPIKFQNESMFFQEWALLSNTNIVRIVYGPKHISLNPFKTVPIINKFVSSRRLDFVALLGFDVVHYARLYCDNLPKRTRDDIKCLKNIGQVSVVGFSMGAHIAAQICRYMRHRLRELCKILLGLDAAGVGLALAQDRFINKNDAKYVQLIITDPKGFLSCGTKKAVGHDNIYFKNFKSKWFPSKHFFSAHLHWRIMTGHLVVIAKPHGISHITTHLGENRSQRAEVIRPQVDEDECLVGIYGTLYKENEIRNFTVSIGTRVKEIFDSCLIMGCT